MKKIDLPKIAFLFGCAVIVFFYGIAVGKFRIFPYALLNEGHDSVKALVAETGTLLGLSPDHFLQPKRYDGDGVVLWDRERATDGLTLISGFFGDSTEIRLIRLDGSIVHRWPARYFDHFANTAHIRNQGGTGPKSNWNIDIHGALALPDGSIVFNYEYGGTVKLDRCGSPVWTLPAMSHHAIDRAAEGGFWIPGQRYIEHDSAFPPLAVPYEEDLIMKVSSEGKIVEQVSVPELMRENGLFTLLLANGMAEVRVPQVELVHVNDIEELSAAMAGSFPMFEAGDLLLSLRNLNLLMVVDPDTWKVKWHQTGPWIRQHDPDFQPDGTITVFNNNADDTLNGGIFGGSNIMKFSLLDGTTTILYGRDDQQHFFTNIRGKHQILPNANILITEFEGGRLIEVDPQGRIVWEFVDRYDDTQVAELTQAQRYSMDYFTFDADKWECR